MRVITLIFMILPKALSLIAFVGIVISSVCAFMSCKLYLKKQKDIQSITLYKMFRRAINTIVYMKCFPECIRNGIPKISFPRGEERSDNNVIFKTSDTICNESKSQKIYSIFAYYKKNIELNNHYKLLLR
ncbi:hypothetical protein J2772_000943 [Chryseobacterium jejuense]|nr:hypothetical protein [Chryseobacterium jejuense]